MSIGIRPPLPPPPPLRLVRLAWTFGVIITTVLATFLTVRLIFDTDNISGDRIDDLTVLSGILWTVATAMIVIPLIGVRPPIPEPEPQPQPK